MQGYSRHKIEAVTSRAPDGRLEGTPSLLFPGNADGLIASRKNAGRDMRTGVFFGGFRDPVAPGRGLCGIH